MKKIIYTFFVSSLLLMGCIQQEPISEDAKIDDTFIFPQIHKSRNDYVKQSCFDKKNDNIWYPYIEENKESKNFGSYGWKNIISDEIMVPAEYPMVFGECYDSTKRKGFAAFVVGEGVWYRDANGKKIIQAYTSNGPDDFSSGLARFIEDKKIGFMDEELNKVIPAQFDWASLFKDGEAKICNRCKLVSDGEHGMYKGGVWGKVNLKGEIQWID